MNRSVLIVSILLVGCLTPLAAAADHPPLRVAAEGQVSAFDLEVLSTFAKLHARPLQAVAGTTAGADVYGAFSDAVAKTAFGTTREVFPSRLVAVTRRQRPRASAIEALRWSKIGVVRGSRAAAAVHDAKVSGAELTEYKTMDAATAGLRDAEVGALLLELPEALVVQRADAQLELGVLLGMRRSWVYAVPTVNSKLLRDLDSYLESLRRTPSWAAMITRHYGPHALETLSRAHLAD